MENTIINNMSLLNETWVQESIAKTKFLNLPMPSPQAIQHSEKLMSVILDRIHSQKGSISFAEYMQLALYEPGLGYYSAGNQKFGPQGDFVTAPEISPLFSYCLARECHSVLQNLSDHTGIIIELGAGSGKMAADILLYLSQINSLPEQYLILEVSAELKERQQHTLQHSCPQLLHLVEWINTLPSTPLKGIILANEVCDAMPAHRFCLHENKLYETYVGLKENHLCLINAFPSDELSQAISQSHVAELNFCLDPRVHGDDEQNVNYTSEINLNIDPWIQSLSASLKEGLIFIIDYGFPAHEYYHPSRHMGTLMCHYRHHAHNDPLLWPGLQDITAHVDFTSIAESALNANLEVQGFTNQASFLIGAGLLDIAQNELLNIVPNNSIRNQLQIKHAIQTLTSPAEMGELFKIIALSKNFNHPLAGFSLNDMRYHL